jgi:hypothetical protein
MNHRTRRVRSIPFTQFLESKGVPIPKEYMNARATDESVVKGIRAYDKPLVNETLEMMDSRKIAEEWVYRYFSPYMMRACVIGDEEAVDLMDRSKSCGFPWNTTFANKGEFLDEPANRAFLRVYYDTLTRTDEPTCFFTMDMKEEMRPLEKLKDGKIRAVFGASVEGVYTSHRLYYNQRKAMSANHEKLCVKVGIDPFGGGWQRLGASLQKSQTDPYVKWDYSAMDASTQALQQEAVARIRLRWLRDATPEEEFPSVKEKHEAYYHDVIYSHVVLPDGTVVETSTGGNKSGQGNTTEDNEMVQLLNLAIAVHVSGGDYDEFLEVLEQTALYGDDGASRSPILAKLFPIFKVVVRFYHQRDLKGGVVPEKDFDFISRSFSKHRDYIIPEIVHPDKLLGSMLWRSNAKHGVQGDFDRCNGLGNVGYGTWVFELLDDFALWVIDRFPVNVASYLPPDRIFHLITGTTPEGDAPLKSITMQSAKPKESPPQAVKAAKPAAKKEKTKKTEKPRPMLRAPPENKSPRTGHSGFQNSNYRVETKVLPFDRLSEKDPDLNPPPPGPLFGGVRMVHDLLPVMTEGYTKIALQKAAVRVLMTSNKPVSVFVAFSSQEDGEQTIQNMLTQGIKSKGYSSAGADATFPFPSEFKTELASEQEALLKYPVLTVIVLGDPQFEGIVSITETTLLAP